jgi:stearoyl-CoA desaturase (Delta-9 desaturase)
LSQLLFRGVFDLPWWGIALVALGLTHITIASVTIFLHRHQAHRALDLHPLPSHLFRFWLWLTTGMVTREWVAVHRKHHAFVETPNDPHSPQIYGINRVLWGGVMLYVKESNNTETLERYAHGVPDDWIERHLYSRFTVFGMVFMGLLDLVLFGVLPGAAILLVQIVWIPFWAAGVINGVGHFWGYRSYACGDASTNIVPWGILIGGEELHNNHHAFASSAKLSCRWYEFDIGWAYIRALEMLGLARVKKVAPQIRFAPNKVGLDFDTLQAVITHRYDVLSRYAKSVRATCAEEIVKLRARSPGDALALKRVRGLLMRDPGQLPAAAREDVASVLAKNSRLSTVVAMRQELTALWERSSASREQLLRQLEDWCARAEASGIAQLAEFSRRLRLIA